MYVSLALNKILNHPILYFFTTYAVHCTNLDTIFNLAIFWTVLISYTQRLYL